MSDVSKEGDVAGKLMSALISKMESMDGDLQVLKAENAQLKTLIRNPSAMLRKAGFVTARTNMPRDVQPDEFRDDFDDGMFTKGEGELSMPTNNAGFHNTSWDDIHMLAEKSKKLR
jgi:hypothetical protein